MARDELEVKSGYTTSFEVVRNTIGSGPSKKEEGSGYSEAMAADTGESQEERGYVEDEDEEADEKSDGFMTLEFEVVDPNNNEPLCDAPYTLKLPDGSEREGNLDENGYLKEENVPEGEWELEVHNEDYDIIIKSTDTEE